MTDGTPNSAAWAGVRKPPEKETAGRDTRWVGRAVVIGGFEVSYKAKAQKWILHINLVIMGGSAKAIAKFESSFDESELDRPTMTVELEDLPEQLSYMLKLCTYHRPFKQHGPGKSRAVSLNRREHLALVRWMDQREFSDFLFLYNVRRQGARFEPRPVRVR